jgi:hypothetical protein
MNIDLIKECRSLGELQSLWLSHMDELSRLPKDEVKALIQAKDSHKSKLETFEEWLYWFQERAAILEFDGGLSREQSDDKAKDAIFDQAMSDTRDQIW